MITYFIAYIIAAFTFLVIDALWLGIIAKDFYFSQLGHLMRERPNFAIAAGFYLIYVVGLVFFAIKPALESGEWKTALIHGALFGFFCYATYDLTNMATLKDWPKLMSGVDIVWGVVLSATTSVITFFTIVIFFKDKL